MQFSISKKGFTFVELLVIIGILIVLTVIAVPSFRYFQKELDLNNSAEEIINILRLAQNKTIASEGASQYGVYFETEKYVLFKGANYDPLVIDNEVHNLPENVEIYEINLGGVNEVVFNRLTGTTNQSGSISLGIKPDFFKTKTIFIESTGQIGENIPSIPTDGRRKDSRHVHFDYNQNVQNAVTLHLVFPDYPDDNYDISFQDYLNTDKTEFSWEGIVSVGPDGSETEQRLKIHTHSLTVMAVQFCIHRPLSPDQSYNDKALNVFLDSEELIKYAADEKGTTTRGLSNWVGEPELQ